MDNKGTTYPLSDLEETILSVLSGGRQIYGLQISKTIELGSHGKLQIGFGSLYPALRRLEARKLVESAWGNSTIEERGGARRRYYKITATGEMTLKAKREIRDSIANYKDVMAEAF